MVRSRGWSLLALGLAQGSVLAASPQAQATAPLEDKDALLVSLYIGRTSFQDLMTVLPARGTFFVPLGDLCQRLGFGIRVHPLKGTVEGFLISPGRTFFLDPASGLAIVEKRRLPFRADQVEFLNGELYVAIGLLAQWFPMEVELEPKGSALLLTPKEKLPIQAQWELEQKYASLGRRMGLSRKDDPMRGPPLPDPYRAFEVPMVDLSLNGLRPLGKGSGSWSGTALAGGDLLWMSALGMVSRDSSGKFSHSRLSLFRENPDGMGGVLGLRRIHLGDLLVSPALDIVGRLPTGRGVLLDNYPIAYRSTFANRAFRGLLPEGWSVELYQNGALLEFRRANATGTFEFNEVPLRFGLNQFRLVFQGPLGERRVEVYRYDIAQELPSPGQVFYRVAGVQNTELSSVGSGAVSGANPQAGGPQAQGADRNLSLMGELEVGLTRWLAMRAGYLAMDTDGGRKDFGVAGFTAMVPYLVTRFSVAAEDDRALPGHKGLAAEGQLMTGFEYATLSVRQSEYRRGFQPLQGAGFGGAPMRSQSEVLLQVPAGTLSMPFSTSLSRRGYVGQDGKRVVQDGLMLSRSFRELNTSVALTRTSGSDPAGEGLKATLMLSTYWRRFSLQGDVSYGKTGGRSQFQECGAMLDYRDARDLLYRLRVNGNLANGQPPSAVLSVNKLLGRVAIGFTAQHSKGAGTVLGVNVGLSIGREPRTGTWSTNAQQMAGTGALSLQVFQDVNGNGQRESGEPVIEDARFKVAGGSPPNQSRDPKVTFFTGLGRSQDLWIQLDESSLPDASLHAGQPGYRILPRTGHVQRVDVPVLLLGEVYGTTRLRAQGQKVKDLGGLEVEIVRADGTLVQRLRTAYDGFFEFLRLVPGAYVLRVTPEEAKRLGLAGPVERAFTIDATRTVLDGLDLVVDAPPPPPATSDDGRNR